MFSVCKKVSIDREMVKTIFSLAACVGSTIIVRHIVEATTPVKLNSLSKIAVQTASYTLGIMLSKKVADQVEDIFDDTFDCFKKS